MSRADAKRSGATGRGKAAATPGAANTKKALQPQQGSLKDYFATVKVHRVSAFWLGGRAAACRLIAYP